MAMIKVCTPFGIGFASSIEDLQKLTEFLKPYSEKYEKAQEVISSITGVPCVDKVLDEKNLDDIVIGSAIASGVRGMEVAMATTDDEKLLADYLKKIR